MKILVINCGSSSIKYKLYDMTDETELAAGLIERMNQPEATIIHQVNGQETRLKESIPDAKRGVERLVQLLTTIGDPAPLSCPDELVAVGHRVVHGGEAFSESVIVDEKVLATIEECAALAPLHNPANLAGLLATMEILPGKPQVAVFDTAFFHTMPPAAYHYALDYSWYEKYQVRRYGFHGSSHRYVAMMAAQLLKKPRPNLITLHLGNGCSMACIKEGQAIDQTMGMTPLEGLVMGTRSGDFDPGIIFHMVRQGMSLDDVRTGVEKKSGLLGLSGVSADLRDVYEAEKAGDQKAALAIKVFVHRTRKYIGAFLAELGTCDAIVFAGGIGENAVFMRERILAGLEPLGIEIDPKLNNRRSREPFPISSAACPTAVWVIPTNEELMIARDAGQLIGQQAPARESSQPAYA